MSVLGLTFCHHMHRATSPTKVPIPTGPQNPQGQLQEAPNPHRAFKSQGTAKINCTGLPKHHRVSDMATLNTTELLNTKGAATWDP